MNDNQDGRKFPYFDWQLWALYTALLVGSAYYRLYPTLADGQKKTLNEIVVGASAFSACLVAGWRCASARERTKKPSPAPGDDVL